MRPKAAELRLARQYPCAARPNPYPARVVSRSVLLALLALAVLAPSARAAPVLVVGDAGAAYRDDPALPPDAMAAPPPGGVRPCAASPAAATAAATVPRTLARAEAAGAISAEQHDAWLGVYRHARGVAARMRSSRRSELRAVVAGVEALARRRAQPRRRALPPPGAARAARPDGRARLPPRRLHGVGVLLRLRRRHAAL